MTTMRLQRLHFSSSPSPRTLAISWPHSQRVSWEPAEWLVVVVVLIIVKSSRAQMKLRTIISISFSDLKSSSEFDRQDVRMY